jgi:hypothetical protein
MPDPVNPSVPVATPAPSPITIPSDPAFITSHQKMSQAMVDALPHQKLMAESAAVQAGMKFTAAQVWLLFANSAMEGKLTASSNDMATFADDMLEEFKTRFAASIVVNSVGA